MRSPAPPRDRAKRPCAQGFVTWNRNALQRDLENGVYGRVSDDEMPWDDLWALTGDDDADASARAKCGLEVFDAFVSATTYVNPDDETVVGADLDPGYEGTAVMFGQAALALAAGEGSGAGVLTPATALGPFLVDRLRSRGFTLTTRPLPAG